MNRLGFTHRELIMGIVIIVLFLTLAFLPVSPSSVTTTTTTNTTFTYTIPVQTVTSLATQTMTSITEITLPPQTSTTTVIQPPITQTSTETLPQTTLTSTETSTSTTTITSTITSSTIIIYSSTASTSLNGQLTTYANLISPKTIYGGSTISFNVTIDNNYSPLNMTLKPSIQSCNCGSSTISFQPTNETVRVPIGVSVYQFTGVINSSIPTITNYEIQVIESYGVNAITATFPMTVEPPISITSETFQSITGSCVQNPDDLTNPNDLLCKVNGAANTSGNIIFFGTDESPLSQCLTWQIISPSLSTFINQPSFYAFTPCVSNGSSGATVGTGGQFQIWFSVGMNQNTSGDVEIIFD